MAIDTAQKRFSIANVLMPFRGVGTLPTGTVDQGERQAIMFTYSGILFGVPVAVTGSAAWYMRRRRRG